MADGSVRHSISFELFGDWIRTIDMSGSYPVVRYKVPQGGSGTVTFYYKLNASSISINANHVCAVNAEIIVIGETVHFPFALAEAALTNSTYSRTPLYDI